MAEAFGEHIFQVATAPPETTRDEQTGAVQAGSGTDPSGEKPPNWRRAAVIGALTVTTAVTAFAIGRNSSESSAPPTTTAASAPSLGVENPEGISPAPDQIEAIGGIITLAEREYGAENLFRGIDWSTRETMLSTLPSPMEVILGPDETVDAQEILDAVLVNTYSAVLSGDPDGAYQEAMIHEYPDRNIRSSIDEFTDSVAPYYANEALSANDTWRITEWGLATGIEAVEGEDIDFMITGQVVRWSLSPIYQNLEIIKIELGVVAESTDDGGTRLFQRGLREVGDPLFQVNSTSQDDPYHIFDGFTLEEEPIILPYNK